MIAVRETTCSPEYGLSTARCNQYVRILQALKIQASELTDSVKPQYFVSLGLPSLILATVQQPESCLGLPGLAGLVVVEGRVGCIEPIRNLLSMVICCHQNAYIALRLQPNQ